VQALHDFFDENPVSPENSGIAKKKINYRRKILVTSRCPVWRAYKSGVDEGLTRSPRRK